MITWQLFLEKKNGQYSYSNTQVMLPKDLANKIIKWGKENVPDSDVYTDPEDDSYGREDEVHVTVLYGLHSKDAESVRDIIEAEKPIEVTLKTVSKFESEKYDVLKIGIESDGLNNLNKSLSALPNSNKFPKYIAHATIAYVKKDKGDKLVGANDFEGKKFTADSVVFSNPDHERTSISLKGNNENQK